MDAENTTEKPLVERLAEFLGPESTETSFKVTNEDVATIGHIAAQERNAIMTSARSAGFDVAHEGDALIIRRTLGKPPATLYKNNDPDARQSDSKVNLNINNPFRPRYRKLAQSELDYHDKIRLEAFTLLETIRNVVKVRADAGQTSSGEELACLKLAERHLEDAVYRAVKALTA